jgi:hypothetical protein
MMMLTWMLMMMMISYISYIRCCTRSALFVSLFTTCFGLRAESNLFALAANMYAEECSHRPSFKNGHRRSSRRQKDMCEVLVLSPSSRPPSIPLALVRFV